MANLDRSLKHVIDTLRYNRNTRRPGCSLLIGAGCSKTAGIKTAAGFVELIKHHFEAAYDSASDKTYPACMAKLTWGEKRRLINDQVCNARINWAHIAIAQLMRNGYVDRVLTTNFDPLVLRACAMLGEFPAVYDFALSQLFKPGELPDKAVFHLHGQSTGFVLMNTDKEVAEHSERLGPLFHDAGQARPWIVVGYSGDNDPVFDHLARVKRFDYGLYWVGFRDEEPQEHIRKELLQPGKDAYLVRGYDADRFFVELAQKLDCFPPEFVRRPFSFLKTSLSKLTKYRLLSNERGIDILLDLRGLVDRAIAEFEEPKTKAEYMPAPSHAAIELAAPALLMAEKYEDLERLQGTLGADQLTASLRDTFAWSSIMQGNMLSDQAKTKSGAEADALFEAAGEKHEAALALKPDMHEALWSWGNALSDQARAKSGAEADALFESAGEKYAAALVIKPDMHEALYNWGNALSAQAETKSGAEADALFEAAGEKYEAALALKPDNDMELLALFCWGSALSDQAQTKSGAEADALFAAAGEKYEAVLAIKPDNEAALWGWGNALRGWGNVLSDQAETKSGAEADALFAAAGAKYEAALALKPDMHEALWSWGNALSDQARTKRGAEADALFEAAGEKYEAALALKPDDDMALWALLFWGSALWKQAQTKSGAEADALFAAAGEKYAAALALKPDIREALLGWGVALADQAKTKSGDEAERMLQQAEAKLLKAENISTGSAAYDLARVAARRGDAASCQQWLERSREYGRLSDRRHLLADSDLASVRDQSWFRAFLEGE